MFILKTGHQPGVYVPLRALFLVLISSRVMDGISSNLAYTFISTGQIIIIKSKHQGPFL